jgi:hypothetical protein
MDFSIDTEYKNLPITISRQINNKKNKAQILTFEHKFSCLLGGVVCEFLIDDE